MNRFLNIIYMISIFLLFVSCSRGVLIVDPYWAAMMKMQGENPKVIAKNARLSYFELSGRTEEDIRNMLLLITRLKRKGQWVILSPWMEKFISDLNKERFRIGLLNMQGIPVLPISGIYQAKVSRTQVLESLLRPLDKENAQVILFYNSADDFYTFTQNIQNENNLFPIYVGNQEDVQRIEQTARTILALRDIKAMFILAEPYNYALWLELEDYIDHVEKIYSSGVHPENDKFYLFNDNVGAQIHAILSDEDLNVQAQLKK